VRAAPAATGLLAAGAALTRSRGYGTYPQVLEGTGAAILYVVAFSAHAVPYYQAETQLTELGGGVLMALVAAGTVALALLRDARVIAGLGYTLAFITAGLGFGVLPAITLPYLAILGTSLAWLVARKRWLPEALAGTVATGVFFVAFALDAGFDGRPRGWTVLAYAVLPAAAFLWLTLRPREDTREQPDPFLPLIAAATVAWMAYVSCAPALEARDGHAQGLTLLVWAVLAAGLGIAAALRPAGVMVPAAYGVAAVALYLLWPPLLWDGLAHEAFAVTATYAAGALALVLLQSSTPALQESRGAWAAGFALAAAAAFRAVFLDGRIVLFEEAPTGGAVGPWEAWVTLLLLAPALALLAFRPVAARGDGWPARIAFGLTVLFVGAWAFALFYTAFLTTLFLLVAGAALVAGAIAAPAEGSAGRTLRGMALGSALLLIVAAAVKSATYDAHAADPGLPLALAAVEALLVAGVLLGVFHLAAREDLAPGMDLRALGAALVGGSALVLGSFVFAYAEGPWVSVYLGTLAVAYLLTGFVLPATGASLYRYTGFGVLGFVLLRVFLVDLKETDLAVRAAVFAVLGAILLGVGYVYARLDRSPPQAP